MRIKLSYKFAFIMLGTVLLSAALSAFLISRTTRSIFLELVRENDIQTAVILSENLANYYSRNKSWTAVEGLLERFHPYGPSQGGPGMMRGMGQPGQTGLQGQRQFTERPPLRMLLTDTQGKVVLHNLQTDLPSKVAPAVLNKGVPVRIESGIIGYVFVQSMIEPVIGPFQKSFLTRVYRAVFLSMLIVGVLAPLLGIALMRHITLPLQRLTAAAALVAMGKYDIDNYNSLMYQQRTDEIGDLSRSFQYMTGRIQAADEWKRALIADSAHELRTPVSLLQGNIEMMLEGIYPLDVEHLEMLRDETIVLMKLVKELQDLADAEAGISSYTFERLDVLELLRTLVKENIVSSRKKGHTLETGLVHGELFVYADKQKLIQVFSNILQNAIRYTPFGGVISIEAELNSDHMVKCVFEDSGSGIPEDEREKIFQRFYRINQDRNRETGGSGLGLAIAREIVLRHEGTIRAEAPHKHKGARIVIELPRTQK